MSVLVLRSQPVNETKIIQKSGRAQLYESVPDDSAIGFPAGIYSQPDLVGTRSARLCGQIGNVDLDRVSAFTRMAREIELMWNVGNGGTQFSAVHEHPSVEVDGLEANERPLARQEFGQKNGSLQPVEPGRSQR